MRKLLFTISTLLLLPVTYFGFIHSEEQQYNTINTEQVIGIDSVESQVSLTQQLYQEMDLDSVVNYDAFEQAIAGYNKIEDKNKEVLTLIDFSKPSTEERLYVLDLDNKELLFSSLVAHGKKSGDLYATSFSNVNGSNKSSLGFYLTENTYYGKNGYSLVLNGLEKGINDRAKQRAIVIHGSNYVNQSRLARTGKLSRSLGCPALPRSISKEVIDVIKNGSLLFIFADDKDYLVQSPILAGEEFEVDFMG